MLPFDTGNMIGVRISSDIFSQLELVAIDSHTTRNSAGEILAAFRVARSDNVFILGRNLRLTNIYEMSHPDLPGAVGPTVGMGSHFTIDYLSRKIAIGTGKVPDNVQGFGRVPLIRSRRHPKLILVQGTIEGHPVIIEIDTGKSRTVINPSLVSELGLTRATEGVQIKSLRIGDLSFEILNAKEVDQTGIDPDLTAPIFAGIGSDILSRFVWTVDYDSGALWISPSR